MANTKIDYYATAKLIAEKLHEDPDLKLFKDDKTGIEVSIVRLKDDDVTDNATIMKHIEKNKELPVGKRQALFVYNGFDTNSKLIKTSDVKLSKTKTVLKVNDLVLIK